MVGGEEEGGGGGQVFRCLVLVTIRRFDSIRLDVTDNSLGLNFRLWVLLSSDPNMETI